VALAGVELRLRVLTGRVPDFRTATHIVITNERSIGAQVEILDAAILVAR